MSQNRHPFTEGEVEERTLVPNAAGELAINLALADLRSHNGPARLVIEKSSSPAGYVLTVRLTKER